MKISLRDKKISPWNIILSLRDKIISPWDIILFLGDKIISPWKYGNSELYHVVQERAEGPKAPSPMCKKGRDIKKALQEVACCCSLAGDFYLIIGFTYEVFCLIYYS